MAQENQAFISHFKCQAELGITSKERFDNIPSVKKSVMVKEDIKQGIETEDEEIEFNQLREELISFVNQEIQKPHFAYYLKSLLSKWKMVEKEIEIVDTIINSICNKYGISRKNLFKEKNTSGQRSILYYTINKKVSLNYTEIADAFNKHPSVINRAIRQMEFRLTNQPSAYSEIISFINEIDEMLFPKK